MKLSEYLENTPMTLNGEGCEHSQVLYENLLSFAYLMAGKLDMPTGEYGEPIFPEELTMTELLEIILRYYNK